jgi:biofilm PGA synthesis protein PgaA
LDNILQIERAHEGDWSFAGLARRAIIVGLTLLAGTFGAGSALAQTVTERREEAVLQARSGHLNDAIAALRAMLAAGEDDGLVAMDLAALLQQAGKSDEAIAVFEKAAQAAPPEYALLAATHAYRDLHRYSDAEKLARQGLERFPDRTVWPLLLSLVLTDAGHPKQALAILGQPEAQKAPPVERLLAEGYAWRKADEPDKSAAAYGDALKLAPANTATRTEAAAGLVVALQQAGKAREAIAVFNKEAGAAPPDDALLAAARAYRDLRRYDDAERLARQGLKRFPDQTVWPSLLALVLTDAGRPKEALEVLSRPEAKNVPPLERHLAEGYAWRRAGDPFKAISAYTDALKLAPANEEARNAAAALLQAQGGGFGAAALAGTTAPFAPDQAAAMVRWGSDTRPTDPARRFEGTDAAIARLDKLLAERPSPPAAVRRRLRLDRLVALRDRARMWDVVEEALALQSQGPLPAYAEEAYADALLYLRRPQEARAAYCRVLAAGPKDLSPELQLAARYGLFYASVEVEDFDSAYAAIDSIVNDQPIWRTYKDTPARHENPDRVYAEVAAAGARFFGNQLADAWARITRIADAAPANKWARATLYQIARARGWPRRAKIEGEIAASLDPDSVGTKIALAEIAIADYRFARAKRMVGDLLAQFPEDRHVQRLARELDADLGWLVETEAKPSNSSGGGANAAGQALTLQTKVTTPPIADNWQLFAVTDYANAHPPEGFVQRGRLSGGIAWRSPDFTATLYPSQSWGTLGKAGGGATLDWSMTDQFRLSFAGELYSWDTPLRALLHGITADSYSTKATYRWDESRSLSGSFGYMPFTDGNERFVAGAIFAQKLINVPHFDLTSISEVSASHNDRPDAPYYNPDSDLTVDTGLLAEHTLWRCYDASLVQALSVNAGLYAEAHHGTNVIATVSYEHRWRFDPYGDFHYGIQFARRVYDGSVENTGTVTLGARWRF